MLKLNLEQTDDYEVMVENIPNKALRVAHEFQPDLILLDVLMPGMDGGELASHVQASPRLGRVPIVFLSAAATKAEVSAHHGVVGGLPFLAKPVDMPEVLASLRRYIAS